jgi:heat shock protein HslJ
MDMDTEKQFLQALQTTDSYTVRNDTLVLNRERTIPLARFAAVYR